MQAVLYRTGHVSRGRAVDGWRLCHPRPRARETRWFCVGVTDLLNQRLSSGGRVAVLSAPGEQQELTGSEGCQKCRLVAGAVEHLPSVGVKEFRHAFPSRTVPPSPNPSSWKSRCPQRKGSMSRHVGAPVTCNSLQANRSDSTSPGSFRASVRRRETGTTTTSPPTRATPTSVRQRTTDSATVHRLHIHFSP